MRIPIRSKLAGALLLPLLALVAVAGYEVRQADAKADEAASEELLATSAVGPNSLISNLQNERNFMGVDQLGMLGAIELPVASYEESRQATDESIAALEALVASGGEELEGVFDAGLEAAGAELAQLRSTVDASTLPKSLENQAFAEQIFLGYTQIIDVLMDDTSGIAFRVDDADLRTGVEMVGLTTETYEIGSQVVKEILLSVITGNTDVTARIEVARLNAESDRIDRELLDRSVGPYEGLPEEHLLAPEQLAQDELLKQFENTGTADITQLAGGLRATEEAGTLALRNDVSVALDQEAAGIVDDAEQQKQLVVLFAVVAVAAALVITVLASRSITSPLRSLTRQARTMATDRLPNAVQKVLDTPLGDDVVVPDVAPVTVKTRDEVADVAAALNTVQGSALDLAVEQAVLRRNIADSFVNLGRRNQNLLDRQLDFITDLERQEQEPDRLEGLFRLDHLATRMRRNAESLLRLAGGGSDTSTGWSGPVPMVDVVRGALGEVEDYQRVDVRALQAATVSGTAGADLAHALAELVENALSFSPPHERVEIRGRRGDNGGYVLAVIDQGVGMTDEQLDVANRRLAGKESFTVAPSRYLGHYVAGYLAANHGITIELRSTAAGGVTARLDIPAALLVSEGDLLAPSAPVAPYEPIAPVAPVPVESYEPVAPAEPVAPVPAESYEPIIPVAPVHPVEPTEPMEPVARYEPPAPVEPAPVIEPIAPVAPAPAEPVSAEPFYPDGAGLPRRSIPADDLAGPAPEPVGRSTEPVPVGLVGNGADSPAVVDGRTPGGLARRVRGANAPVATNVAAAFGGVVDAPVAPVQSVVSSGPVAAGSESSADDVASWLSAFSGGVERGLSEAHLEEEDQ